MSAHERIIGVAFRHSDQGVYSLPAPARHGQVLRLVAACYPDQPHAAHDGVQGFVTDRARFVTREQAREIVVWEMRRTTAARLEHYPALKNHLHGLAPSFEPEPSSHRLQIFSEDLW
ncbi:hypothetical protein EVC03_117 [Rhizobium phage RHph_Y5A]|nr:hypothetical protein EVC03_117 [Rhizobium phage RHph_Y5A]QIG75559.1 hypothetical protein EVC18_117 [Rhizobium phage RHph_Y2_4]